MPIRHSPASLDGGLDRLINNSINPIPFQGSLRHLQDRFTCYTDTCPLPVIAAGLIVTPEIRLQSERYLPIAEITAAFNRLYRAALRYPPILSSSPFHHAISWADVFVALPPRFQFSANPARLLQALLAEGSLRAEFLFASFLPRRFYGGCGRYPAQQEFIRGWLEDRERTLLCCLDAACGTGEDTYGLARLLLDCGYPAESVQLAGWTLEPLEVWAAAQRRIPHDPARESAFREWTAWLSGPGGQEILRFEAADLLNPPPAPAFDLILCNGLLGGPIVHDPTRIAAIVRNLTGLLAPGGLLLAADCFHGGWKQQCPQQELRALLSQNGLSSFTAGEGVGGLKLDQHAAPG